MLDQIHTISVHLSTWWTQRRRLGVSEISNQNSVGFTDWSKKEKISSGRKMVKMKNPYQRRMTDFNIIHGKQSRNDCRISSLNKQTLTLGATPDREVQETGSSSHRLTKTG